MPLDPKQFLRDDHLKPPGSVGVVLADGQEWLIPRPQLYVTPSDDLIGYEHVAETGDRDFDATLNERFRALRDALEDPTGGKSVYAAKFSLYRAMIARNYDLTTDQLRAVLRFKLSRTEQDPLDAELMRVAQGLDGERDFPAGDDSP